MFKRSKEPEKKGSEKKEDLLVSFLKDAHFVFAIIELRLEHRIIEAHRLRAVDFQFLHLRAVHGLESIVRRTVCEKNSEAVLFQTEERRVRAEI